MNTDATSSVRPSDTTSTTRPTHTDPRRLDEATFLKQEGAEAKAAISQTLEELKGSLQTAADLSLWTRQHPWAALGVAAAAGFAVANAVTPSKHKAAPPPWQAYPPAGYATGATAANGQQGASPLNSLLAPLFDMAKVALQSTIASAIGGVMTKEAVEANTPPQPQDVSRETVTSETSAAL
jgi:hypothetical protein